MNRLSALSALALLLVSSCGQSDQGAIMSRLHAYAKHLNAADIAGIVSDTPPAQRAQCKPIDLATGFAAEKSLAGKPFVNQFTDVRIDSISGNRATVHAHWLLDGSPLPTKDPSGLTSLPMERDAGKWYLVGACTPSAGA